MRIKFWGTRGSIAVPGKDTILYGGNTTCLEITLESGYVIIIDAGTGIRPLGDKLSAERETLDVHLLITHIHWDHVLGFPYFGPLYKSSTHLKIDGYPTCMNGLKNTFDNKMGDGFFPVKFADLKAKITYLDKLRHGDLEVEGAAISAAPLHHPQGGFAFRFKEGRRVFVFMTDNELREDPWKGRTPKDYVKFCKDADILVHDSQFTPGEIEERRDWGHSDYGAAFAMADKANVKRLILTHHDPARTDLQVTDLAAGCKALATAKGSDLVIEAAMEMGELEL
jgi:phosphoribosyl 1,2-cyclic phosphodiesterase